MMQDIGDGEFDFDDDEYSNRPNNMTQSGDDDSSVSEGDRAAPSPFAAELARRAVNGSSSKTKNSARSSSAPSTPPPHSTGSISTSASRGSRLGSACNNSNTGSASRSQPTSRRGSGTTTTSNRSVGSHSRKKGSGTRKKRSTSVESRGESADGASAGGESAGSSSAGRHFASELAERASRMKQQQTVSQSQSTFSPISATSSKSSFSTTPNLAVVPATHINNTPTKVSLRQPQFSSPQQQRQVEGNWNAPPIVQSLNVHASSKNNPDSLPHAAMDTTREAQNISSLNPYQAKVELSASHSTGSAGTGPLETILSCDTGLGSNVSDMDGGGVDSAAESSESHRLQEAASRPTSSSFALRPTFSIDSETLGSTSTAQPQGKSQPDTGVERSRSFGVDNETGSNVDNEFSSFAAFTADNSSTTQQRHQGRNSGANEEPLFEDFVNGNGISSTAKQQTQQNVTGQDLPNIKVPPATSSAPVRMDSIASTDLADVDLLGDSNHNNGNCDEADTDLVLDGKDENFFSAFEGNRTSNQQNHTATHTSSRVSTRENEDHISSEYEIFDMNQPSAKVRQAIGTDNNDSSEDVDPNATSSTQQQGRHVPGLKAVSGFARRVGGAGGAGRRSPTNATTSTNSTVMNDGTQEQQNQDAGGGNINQRAGQFLGFANRAIRNRVQNHQQQQSESSHEELTLNTEEETSTENTVDGDGSTSQQQHPDRAAQAAAAALAARQAAAKSFGGLANRFRHVAEQRAQQQQQQQSDEKKKTPDGGEIREKSSQEDDYMNFLNFHVKKKTTSEDEEQSTDKAEPSSTKENSKKNDNSASATEKRDGISSQQEEANKKVLVDDEKKATQGELLSSSFSPTRTFLSARAAMSEFVDKKSGSSHGSANDKDGDKSVEDSQHDTEASSTSGKSSDLLSSFSPSRSLASARAAVTEFAAKHAKEEDNKVEKTQQQQQSHRLSIPKMEDATSSLSTLSTNDPSLVSATTLFNRFRGKAMNSLSNHGDSQHDVSATVNDNAGGTVVASLPPLKKTSVHSSESNSSEQKIVALDTSSHQSITSQPSELRVPNNQTGSASVDALDPDPHRKPLDWSGWKEYILPTAPSSEISRSFPKKFIGLEVQYPYSQLIMKGDKTIDVRRYKLPPALLLSAQSTRRRTPILILETGTPNSGQKVVAKQSGLGNRLQGTETINSKIQIVGWCFISDIIHYTSGGQFALDQQLHCVTADSEYGWMEGFTKELFGWTLTDAGSFSATAKSDKLLSQSADAANTSSIQNLVDLPKANSMIRRMRSLFEVQFSDEQATAVASHILATSSLLVETSSQEDFVVEVKKPFPAPEESQLDTPKESSPKPSNTDNLECKLKIEPPEALITSECPMKAISNSQEDERASYGNDTLTSALSPSSTSKIEVGPVVERTSPIASSTSEGANRSASPSTSAASTSPSGAPLVNTTTSNVFQPVTNSDFSKLQEELKSQEEEHSRQQKEWRRHQEESQQVIKQLREALEQVQGQVSSMTQSNSLLSKRCETLQNSQKEQESLMEELQMAYSKQMEQNGELSHTTKTLKDKVSKLESALKSENSEHHRTKEALDLSKATHASEVDALKVERERLEKEITQLKKQAEFRTSHESTTLARLNESKKVEAMKTREVSALQTELNDLRPKLMAATKERDKAVEERNKLSSSVDKIKSKCVERVRLAEEALEKELDLNEERKRKMKEYVNTKADELRRAKEVSDAYRLEVEEMRQHYKSTRDQLEEAQTNLKDKEEMIEALKEDLHQLQTQSENLHKMGDTLENQLTKSAREKEEHKHKRLEAKQELMSLLRKLESEQKVSKELRDKIKFKFTPQALSQQQQLNDGMEELERALLRLSRRLGKSLPPRPGATTMDGSSLHGMDRQPSSNREMTSLASSTGTDGARDGGKHNSSSRKHHNHAAGEATRILDSFGDEQESVQFAIDSLLDSLERIHILLDDRNGERNCISHVAEMLSRIAAGAAPLVPASMHGGTRSSDNGSRMDGGGRLRAFASSATRGRSVGASSFERLPFNPDDTSIL